MAGPRDSYKVPAYVVIDGGALGNDTVALRAFGGRLGDPIAAVIKVDSYTRIQVVAPPARRDWGAAREERFREAVRELAKTHDLFGKQGAVSVLFDPPDTSIDDGLGPAGELIARPGDTD